MMFKISFNRGSAQACSEAISRLSASRSRAKYESPSLRGGRIFLAIFALQMLVVPGCTVLQPPRMPPVDLNRPGWTVRVGQAVWHLPNRETDLAGELVLATHPDGGAFIQFTKSPFTLIVAQSTSDRWEAEFPTQGKRYGGRGNAPKRLIWLQLPHVLAGHPPPDNCTWQQTPTGWKLLNQRTGEALEGYFSQ